MKTSSVSRMLTTTASLLLLVVGMAWLGGHAVTNAKTHLPPPFTTPLEEGASVPSVDFYTRTRVSLDDAEHPANPFDWQIRTTADYFRGKRVVLFSLPYVCCLVAVVACGCAFFVLSLRCLSPKPSLYAPVHSHRK
jgi:hypothetical protein